MAEFDDALELIAQGWHRLTSLGAKVAPEAAVITPLASKIMGLAAAGNPLTEASEAALSVLVDVFKEAEAHKAERDAAAGRPASSPAPGSLPIEAQAAAAVAASGGSVSDSAAPATPDVVTAGDQVVSAG